VAGKAKAGIIAIFSRMTVGCMKWFNAATENVTMYTHVELYTTGVHSSHFTLDGNIAMGNHTHRRKPFVGLLHGCKRNVEMEDTFYCNDATAVPTLAIKESVRNFCRIQCDVTSSSSSSSSLSAAAAAAAVVSVFL